MNTATHWTVPPDHPALAGHFPGTPILPGVVLLDMALQTIANANGITLDQCAISSVKFLSPAKPGDVLLIEHVVLDSGTIRFEIAVGTRKVASGSVVASPPA
jgi:3-hydroxyacyl-[acyl-carrier-protein] dehydratase